MIRAALAFILCVVLGAAALAVSPAQNLIMELPHSRAPAPAPSPGACPFGTAYADGCAGAVAGTPQNPTLLQRYRANRPPWNVAGVDYRVGQSGPMSDPSVPGNLPACATYIANATPGENWVIVNSVPCTLANLDFSLHGGSCLLTSSAITTSGTLTLTNSNFLNGANANCGAFVLIRDNINFVGTYNTMDQGYNPIPQAIFYKETNTGNVTLEYNVLLHASAWDLELGGPGTFTIMYNYARGLGLYANHADWFGLSGNSGGIVLNEAFNTVYSDPTGCCATAICYISPNIQGPDSGYCKNDVYITSISAQAGAAGLGTVSLPVRVEPNGLSGPFTISDIYMDLTGVTVGYGLGATTSVGYAPPAVTCTGNKNLIDGTPLTKVFGTGASWMVCS